MFPRQRWGSGKLDNFHAAHALLGREKRKEKANARQQRGAVAWACVKYLDMVGPQFRGPQYGTTLWTQEMQWAVARVFFFRGCVAFASIAAKEGMSRTGMWPM